MEQLTDRLIAALESLGLLGGADLDLAYDRSAEPMHADHELEPR
ncbi:MAG: hypothetical protein P1V81_14035 [Planctomycetota bacterium]|nr:hypothetical protein [Planctomycetota bacterium]